MYKTKGPLTLEKVLAKLKGNTKLCAQLPTKTTYSPSDINKAKKVLAKLLQNAPVYELSSIQEASVDESENPAL